MSNTAVLIESTEYLPEVDRPRAATESQAPVFVWGCWAILLTMALRYVSTYGSRVPYIEDWFYTDFLTGKLKLTWAYLWEQVARGDHRVPLFKILIYLNYRCFGVDVRPIQFLNVLLFGGLAAGMIWAARRIRGRAEYADAFFPIVLLNLGHGETFLWAEANVYVLTTFLVGSFLIIQVASRGNPGPVAAFAAGTCLALLPLCFGGGVAYVPALALWLGITGYRLARSPEPDRRLAGRICVFFGLVALLLVAAYLTGYKPTRFDEREDLTTAPSGPAAILKATLKYLAMAFGPAARPPAFPGSGLIISGFLLVGAVCLVSSLRQGSSSRRDPALGLTLYLIACLLTSGATGLSRASWSGTYLFEPRYAAASVPILLGLYFVWEVCGPATLIPLGRMVLFGAVTSALALNWSIGMHISSWRGGAALAFERDVRAGVSIPRLVSKYAPVTHHDHEKIQSHLESLRDAKVGEYRHLPPNPRFREVRLALDPADAHNVEWDRKTGRGRATGPQPYLTFDLKEPVFVCGLRIRYSSKNPEGYNPYFQVFMRDSRTEREFKTRRYIHVDLPHDGREVDVPVWIYGTIDQVRIHPDKRPCDFTITEVTLLLPESDSERVPSTEPES